jgi:hypothetical protein
MMGDWTHMDLPAALLRAQRKLGQWRERHRPRARIPEQLWQEAARLACVHGINRTARALRLDYYSLKKRADAADAVAGGGGHMPGFLEILPGGLPAPCPPCTLELEESGGAKMRICLAGIEPADVAALVRAFREGRS